FPKTGVRDQMRLNVRYTPMSGAKADIPEPPLCANSRHWPPAMSSLPPQCKISSQLFKFAPLLRGELVSPQLNVDLVERAAERERHLRVVFVDDRRPSVLPDIETLVEREPERLGQIDATLGHLPAIDRERSGSGLADATAIVCEIENDGMSARRKRVLACDAILVLLLVSVFVA